MEFNYRNQRFARLYTFLDRLESRLNPGVLLLVVALVAIIVANSPLSAWYISLWNMPVVMGINNFNLFSHHGEPLTLLQFVNDALMAVFFFTVGLEIKREMIVGELSSPKHAMLPIVAALGGMVIPVIVFFVSGKMLGFSPQEFRGMAIPMATDIAFSIGVLSLLGKRVPIALKIFLLALAIVDDIGGIIVIAAFYSQMTSASVLYLLVAVALLLLLVTGNWLRINSKFFYVSLGVIVWYLFLQAGVHPTIAGVLVAFTVPSRPFLNLKKFTQGMQYELDEIKTTIDAADGDSILLNNKQINHLSRLDMASDRVVSPLQDFENNLSGVVNYFIMPLFAFANAGVLLHFSEGKVLAGVTVAVLLGLCLGKVLGIYLFSWIAIRIKLASLSPGVKWGHMLGVAMLGGVGFTVALFLAGLSYPTGSDMLNHAKLGVVFGSFLSGIVGFAILKLTLKK